MADNHEFDAARPAPIVEDQAHASATEKKIVCFAAHGGENWQ